MTDAENAAIFARNCEEENREDMEKEDVDINFKVWVSASSFMFKGIHGVCNSGACSFVAMQLQLPHNNLFDSGCACGGEECGQGPARLNLGFVRVRGRARHMCRYIISMT